MKNFSPCFNTASIAVLPGKKGAVLCRINGNTIHVLQELDFPYSDKKHTIGGNNWIVALCEDERDPLLELSGFGDLAVPSYLFRAKIKENGTLERLPDIPLSQLSLNNTLAISGDTVYMGGHMKRKHRDKSSSTGEIAGFMNLLDEAPVWQQLPIPVEMKAGKSIDDLLIYDNKLVLVDNIIYPKYLFEYDICNPLAPVSTKTIELPNNGTYEHINRGCINKNWMALYSSGVCREGVTYYLTVQRLQTFDQVLQVRLLDLREFGFESDEEKPFNLREELEKESRKINIADFALAGDELLVACGHHGIISYSLRELWEGYEERQKDLKEADEEWAEILAQETPKFSKGIIIESGFERSDRKDSGVSYNLRSPKENQRGFFLPDGFDTVDNLIQLPDDRVVAVSMGETGLKLDYQVLSLS